MYGSSELTGQLYYAHPATVGLDWLAKGGEEIGLRPRGPHITYASTRIG